MFFLNAGKNQSNPFCSGNILSIFFWSCVVITLAISTPAAGLDFEPLCHSEAGGNLRSVSNCAALNTALSNANPGDVIILANGTYTCGAISARSGTASKPIVIRAANPRQAQFTSDTFTISGNYNVVANLTFDNSGVNVTGSYNRITGNKFQNSAGPLRAAVTVDRGNRNRIDHNEVVDYGVGQRGFRILPTTGGNNTAKNNVIDRNYLHRSLGARQNGADAVQLGSNLNHTTEQLYTIVEYNLIEQWEIDAEIISNKSSKNIIRLNTVGNSNATGPIRHGSFVDVISNYFFGLQAVVIQGDDHRAIGNIVENSDLIIRNGDTTQDDLSTGTGHPAARRTLVAGNTVINGEICVGCRIPGGDAASGVPARYTDLKANKATVTLLEQQNTTQASTYSGTVVTAVRLFPQNVGPGSPDVCGGSPSGSNPPPVPPSGVTVGSAGSPIEGRFKRHT